MFPYPAAVLAAGGITTRQDLEAVAGLKGRGVAGALIGRAFYTGDITLPQALATATAPTTGRRPSR
ncbi:HisA/HisF-related TIM barrel protein [Streptomyces sp. NPDC007369]|uniref:HisA/HisF-related TIM barrel protein n=1 Tax=Streptomyces sp. NPDC007369 TaxID=3154589 RepID=UPI0033D274F1